MYADRETHMRATAQTSEFRRYIIYTYVYIHNVCAYIQQDINASNTCSITYTDSSTDVLCKTIHMFWKRAIQHTRMCMHCTRCVCIVCEPHVETCRHHVSSCLEPICVSVCMCACMYVPWNVVKLWPRFTETCMCICVYLHTQRHFQSKIQLLFFSKIQI